LNAQNRPSRAGCEAECRRRLAYAFEHALGRSMLVKAPAVHGARQSTTHMGRGFTPRWGTSPGETKMPVVAQLGEDPS
jgi:hypothetical protein